MKFEHLVGAVVHDLKNQLQALIDYEQEAMAKIPERYHQHLDPILQYTNQIKNNTLQMVTLFRLEQKQSFNLDDAWPHDTVADAIRSASMQFPALQFSNQIDEDCQGFYNEQLLQLALVTLITNSAQAGATHITLSASEGSELVITVEDNGHGFDERVLNREIDTTKAEGSGLGLFFVQLIAERHKINERVGSVHYRNRKEGGALVSIHLPL